METQRQGQALVDFSSPWERLAERTHSADTGWCLTELRSGTGLMEMGGNGNLWISLFLIETRAEVCLFNPAPPLSDLEPSPKGHLREGQSFKRWDKLPPPQLKACCPAENGRPSCIQTPETDPGESSLTLGANMNTDSDADCPPGELELGSWGWTRLR